MQTMRLSAAFNFGSCDPVVVQCVVLPGKDGPHVRGWVVCA